MEETYIKSVYEAACKKLDTKSFRYGGFPPKHGVNITDIKRILKAAIIKASTPPPSQINEGG